MSQELDSSLHAISKASNTCFDLNSNGELVTEEQTVFFQFAERIIFLLNQATTNYDKLSVAFAADAAAISDLNTVWNEANTALTELARSVTSPKLRTAVAKTASAIDRTSTIFEEKLG